MKKIMFRLSPLAAYLLLHYLWAQRKNEFEFGNFLEVTIAIILGGLAIVYLTLREERKKRPDS